MRNILKVLLFALVVFSFKVTSAFALCDKSYNTNLPEDYEWYLVSKSNKASKLLTGDASKTLQFCRQDGDTITLEINNFKDGSSIFFVVSARMKLKVSITLGRDNIQKLLKGEDPRKGYYDSIKIYVDDNKMYMGFYVKK